MTGQTVYVMINIGGIPPGRKEESRGVVLSATMAFGFCPRLYKSVQRGVVRVTDHEMLTLVLMIIALVVSLLDKRDR